MTYIKKLLFICCALLANNSAYAECFDTPEGIKAKNVISIICLSQEKNLKLNIFSSVSGNINSLYVTLTPAQDVYCNTQQQTTKAPPKIFNGKTIHLTKYCTRISNTETFNFDMPSTEAEMNYVTGQVLKNKPLVITSPDKGSPFKATFDTHKYRKMILDTFNINDSVRNDI
ncbi:hypothetical protein NGB58_04210 [Escherichia coli]|nr:hypothetical protein [Escherichia coli]